MGTIGRAYPAITVILLLPGLVRSAPKDPLRFLPDKIDLVIKVDNPRRLIESFTKLDAARDVQQLDQVRQALDTIQVRRFFQFIAYYERDLGHSWPDLVDRLAGGGMALGVKYENGGASPVLLAIQGTDAATMKKFLVSASKVLEEEFNREETKVKFTKSQYKGHETWTYGDGFHLAIVDDALLLANRSGILQTSLDLVHLKQAVSDGTGSILGVKSFADAKKLLPADPLAWAWLNLEYVKQHPDAKNVFTTPRNDSNLTFAFAGWIDAIRRSPFASFGFYRTAKGFDATIRMPAGLDGRAADVVIHLPEIKHQNFSLPLLEPEGVVFSHSFYLDLGAMWEKRGKIFNEKNAKDFETGVKETSRFVPATSLDKLFLQSGVYHRFLIAQPTQRPYAREPGVRIPSFAYVISMRDPEFAKSMEILLRGAAVLAGTQVKLKSFEEKVGDVKIVGYRFPEDGTFPADEQNIRFNFVPCFAHVKDQFIICTDLDLVKQLVSLVEKEQRGPRQANMQMRLYAKGLSAQINASPDQLLTQTILNQAVPQADAKQQVESLLRYVEKLGTLQIETDWLPNEFRFNMSWNLK